MGKKFNAYVAVHKDPAESVFFAPGDDVPEWAEGLVGDHVIAGNEEDETDVRLTDPQYEDDDPQAKFATINTLPPEVGGKVAQNVDEDEDDDGLEEMHKDELKELAESRGLAVSGNKAELVARIREDMEAEEE